MRLPTLMVMAYVVTLFGCGGDTASTSTSSGASSGNAQSQMGTATLGTARLQ
jgi:hypothetical protein